MQKFKKFTVVVPVFFAVVVAASRIPSANAGITVTIGKTGGDDAGRVAAAMADRAGDGAVDSIAQFFKDSASARFVMTNTDDGRALMSKVISTPEAQLSARSYNRFLDRISWRTNLPIRNSLYQRLRQLDDDFAQFRKDNGDDTQLKSTDALSPSETSFLKDRLAQITRDQNLADLYDHQTDFVSTAPQGYEASRAQMTEGQADPQAQTAAQSAPAQAEPVAQSEPATQTQEPQPRARGRRRSSRATTQATPASPATSTSEVSSTEPAQQAPSQPQAEPAPAPARPVAATDADASASQPVRSNIARDLYAGGAVSVLQDSSVRASEGTLQGLQIKLRTINSFFKFMRLSEGDWRSLLGMGGEDFSPQDVVMIRKLNRLMGTLNDYAKARMSIQMFTLQSPGLYNQLNVATAQDTEKFLAGELSEKAYLDARAAAAKTLGMDDIVNTAETKMLQSLDQSRALGGVASDSNSGIIPKLEADVKEQEAQLSGLSSKVDEAQKEVEDLQSQGADSDTMTQAQRKLQMAVTNRDLLNTRLKSAAQQLQSYYWKFVQSYEPLEIFKNLRQGKIGAEDSQSFDLPDSMEVNDSDYSLWGNIYERAINATANEAVGTELKEFATARIGATREFVRQMNDDTGKLFGTKFTDSQYGTEFKSYAQGLMMTMVKRMVMYVGAPGAVVTAVADPKPYENIVDKMWNWVFGEKAKAQASSSSSSSGNDSKSSNAKPNTGSSSSSNTNAVAKKFFNNDNSAPAKKPDPQADDGDDDPN